MPATTSPRRRNLAVLFALGSMSSIQLGAALSQPLFHRLGPAGVVMLRLVFAAVALGGLVRPALAGRNLRELAVPVALGVTSGLLTLAFYEAIARIPLGIAVAIEFTGPLGVALVGSRRWADGIWVALAAGGIGLLTLGHPVHGALDLTGVLLAFAAATGWGAYILLTKRVGQSWPGLGGLAVSLAVAAVVTLPFGLTDFAHRYGDAGKDLAGLALGVLVPLLPYVLELAALRRLPTRVFGVLMSLEPGIGALLGLLILGQSLALVGVVAIILIVGASLGVTLTGPSDEVAIPILVD
jgi:inner membrane transporter RhtA